MSYLDVFRSTATGEPLEPRRLLAGIEAGVLIARGTGGNDLLALSRGSGDTLARQPARRP